MEQQNVTAHVDGGDNLVEFFDAKKGPVPFEVPGIAGKLYCKVLTLEEMNAIILGSKKGDPLSFGSSLLAATIVTAEGVQRAPEVEKWRGVSASKREMFNEMLNRSQRINGMLTEPEAEDLGKPSAPTVEPDSSSSSASD